MFEVRRTTLYGGKQAALKVESEEIEDSVKGDIFSYKEGGLYDVTESAFEVDGSVWSRASGSADYLGVRG